jgi:putative phosphoesterase
MRSIGLISDTHGLMREDALRALEGSDLIVHAGDVGRPEILESLRTIARVVAVRGNIDIASWAAALPATAVVEAGPARLYVVHRIQDLDFAAAADCNVVISGHSHQPGSHERGGVLYINPGSAGPRRFRLPITVAHLEVSGLAVKFTQLDPVKRT